MSLPFGLGPEATAAIAASVVVVLGGIVGLVRYVRPRARDVKADLVRARDALIGRDAVLDSITGRELSPALPGMGVRMAHQEQQMGLLTATVAKLAEQQLEQQTLHVIVDDHEKRITKLEAAAVERIVARAESSHAWSAMEAALHATPGDLDSDDASRSSGDVVDVEPPAPDE